MILFASILQRICLDVQSNYFVEHCLMTNLENIKICNSKIYNYICRQCSSCFIFDWYWRNKKSRNSSSLIIKEKNDKKGG